LQDIYEIFSLRGKLKLTLPLVNARIGFLSNIAIIAAEPQQCNQQTRFNYSKHNNTKWPLKSCVVLPFFFGAALRICQTDSKNSNSNEISIAISI